MGVWKQDSYSSSETLEKGVLAAGSPPFLGRPARLCPSAVVSGGGGSSLLSFFFAVPNHGAMQNNKNQGRKSNFWPTVAELIEEEKTLLGKRSLAVHGCCEHNSSWAPGVSPFLPRTSFPFCRCWQRGTAAIFTRLSCAFYVEFWMMACSLHWKFS